MHVCYCLSIEAKIVLTTTEKLLSTNSCSLCSCYSWLVDPEKNAMNAVSAACETNTTCLLKTSSIWSLLLYLNGLWNVKFSKSIDCLNEIPNTVQYLNVQHPTFNHEVYAEIAQSTCQLNACWDRPISNRGLC